MTVDYKKLFANKNIQFLANSSQDSMGASASLALESPEYLQSYFRKKTRFIPPVDFSKPENFARFGSAEKYYTDSIKRIYNTYPYDGSLKERVQWENSSSYLDLYIFDHEYPRANGYVVFSPDGWSAQASDEAGYGEPATKEFILVKGGPHTSGRRQGRDIEDTEGNYKDGYANIYDEARSRESNLKIGGTDGNTVEFWLKKDRFINSLTKKEVIFDIHTTSSVSSSTDYARLTVELTGTDDPDDTSPFLVTYMSGATGLNDVKVGASFTTSSVADGEWHHYAFTFQNSGSSVQVKFYVDGACNDTVNTGSTVNYVSGNLVATIGALA